MPRKTLTALFVAGVMALTGAGAAHAAPLEPVISASPQVIAVGDTSEVTVTGLASSTVYFDVVGQDGATGGTVAPDTVTVVDGEAATTFSSTGEGVFVVTVTDGESEFSLSVDITVEPSDVVTLTAEPAETYVGGPVQVTASGLGGLETALFAAEGVDGATGGSVTPDEVAVVDGVAVTTFSSTAPGTFTVAVTDGETVLATLQITVVDDVPALTAAPTTIAVGATSTVTATGLAPGDEVLFAAQGQNGATGGSVSAATVTVAADGTAVTTFRSTAPGTFLVVLGDGETVQATVTITVVPAAVPVLPATGGEASPLVLWLGVIAFAAGVVVLGAVTARRRSAGRR